MDSLLASEGKAATTDDAMKKVYDEASKQIIGEQERKRKKKGIGRRWEDPELDEPAEDQKHLARIANAFTGPPETEISLSCNLIVIEPDVHTPKEDHLWAIRFVNRKTIASHPNRKQERLNLLRLYGYLVQEKLLRMPTTIRVFVGELVPRKSPYESLDHYPDYFSSFTYWSNKELWNYIRVPFLVVPLAISRVAADFRKRLRANLRGLLPPVGDSQE